MAELAIRRLDLVSRSDCAALIGLLDHYARDPMGGGEGLTAEVKEALPGRLRDVSGYHGAIAWQGGEAVGLINCFQGFSTFKASPLLNIHDIVVRGDRRRRGIGAALLAWAEGRGRELGCCKLTLEVLTGNEPAMRAYNAAGYEFYRLDPTRGTAQLMQRWLN